MSEPSRPTGLTGARRARRPPRVAPTAVEPALDEVEAADDLDGDTVVGDEGIEGIDGTDADEADGADDDGDAPVAVPARSTRQSSRSGRAAAAEPARRSTLFSRNSTTVEPWERSVAFVLGAATTVIGAIYVGVLLADGKGGITALAAVGTLCGIALIAAAYTRRRLPTAFAALFASFLLPGDKLVAWVKFACVMFAGLVIFRTSNEAARKAGEERRQRRLESKPTDGGGGSGRSTTRGRSRTAAPKGPTPNKRYTPPKPKPKPRTQPAPSSRRRGKGAEVDEDG